jgi:hypothetical protein
MEADARFKAKVPVAVEIRRLRSKPSAIGSRS